MAVHVAISRRGPAHVTLTEIAEEAGVTAGALVQRFGSKKKLLVAFAELGPEGTRDMFTRLRAAHDSPLAALRDYADCFARMGESPGTLANHLAFLQLDLTDPDFQRPARAQAKAADKAIAELLTAAVEAGELKRTTNVASLTRTVQVVLGGSLLGWAIRQQGKAITWVRDDLEAVLEPYLRRGATRRASR